MTRTDQFVSLARLLCLSPDAVYGQIIAQCATRSLRQTSTRKPTSQLKTPSFPSSAYTSRKKFSLGKPSVRSHHMASSASEGKRTPAQILLTPVESKLRQLLLDIASHIDSSYSVPRAEGSEISSSDSSTNGPLTLRFTGGWVRDKLLGLGSHDIDVGINSMTGYKFGLKMKEYLEIPGNAEKYGLSGTNPYGQGSLGGLHKIEANPEKSKHLETVTTKIFGLDIDLVNLRKESYSEESRNPSMEFGTPEEDALRRDATINAMFYNLHDRSVEDFTGHGFEDLECKVIRTPLEAYQTFKDDPLRVLRLIRFASRLGYQIDQHAARAMGDDHIKAALKAKISRERVGTEIEKMLRGPDPHMSLELVNEMRLYSIIFTDPTETGVVAPGTESWKQVYDCYQEIYTGKSKTENHVMEGALALIRTVLIRDTDEAYLGWLLAALAPWVRVQPPTSSDDNLPPPLATAVAREGIKATSKVCKIVSDAVRNAREIRAVKEDVVSKTMKDSKIHSQENDGTTRDALGMAIRRWGSHWRLQALSSLLLEVEESESGELPSILERFSVFLQHLKHLDLLDADTLSPPINGKQVAASLDMKSGIWMKGALDAIMAWHFRNPTQDLSDNALNEVESLKIAFVEHILKSVVRPLFDKSPNHSVSPEGRKASQPKRQKYDAIDKESKPWKFDHKYSINLLSWVIRKSDEALVEKYWPMMIPPVLTMVDDDTSEIKAKGCELLDNLLKNTTPALLNRTGLGQVLTDAVMPCLLYLPTLTPEPESIRLLGAAFPALITLARARFEPTTRQKALVNSSVAIDEMNDERIRYFDQIIRRGVLGGYRHAGEYVKIAELLVAQTTIVIDQLGIHGVKYLKEILPLLSDILTAPFGTAYPPLLLAATRCLQTILLNLWPRMTMYKANILEALTICWCRMKDEGISNDITAVQIAIRDTVELLTAVAADEGIKADYKVLVASDERLADLLPTARVKQD